MTSLINSQLKKIELYFLPLAAFFLLISTAVLNFFIVLAVTISSLRIIYNNEYIKIISKKFMLYGLLIFFSNFYLHTIQ